MVTYIIWRSPVDPNKDLLLMHKHNSISQYGVVDGNNVHWERAYRDSQLHSNETHRLRYVPLWQILWGPFLFYEYDLDDETAL